jgi:hypothetical protein
LWRAEPPVVPRARAGCDDSAQEAAHRLDLRGLRVDDVPGQVDGGLLDWQAAGRALVSETGQPALVF